MRTIALLYDRLIAGGIDCTTASRICDLAVEDLRINGCFRLNVGDLWISGHMTAHGLEIEP